MPRRETDVPAARFLVVLDADSTLIQDEAIELLAQESGSSAQVAEVTERAMRGELDFAESLRERVATLQGISDAVFARVSGRMRPTPGAAELVETVHDAGGRVGVVSGGFHELLDPVAERLGVDVWRANRLVVSEGRVTGQVDGDIVDAEEKAATLRAWAQQAGVPLRCTIAIGDGANDLRMMAIAGLSVAFNAKPAVRDAADVALDRVDLSDVLPLLGLRG
ncbi:phosphoserine phosphatase SerB [Paramicrobacterium chengjingii]|uniref:phosphoserine phosphatase n=1 Tax=Paramicrobacterium chengjingii TaxID=2769067 RepID=A0ABX6YM77_9MICO|nr:phosphoserine phosphatase SerB [Microbacterium chengjingii]QPZ39928.1 phosphoserine phosphatase SerB [Microbacterium chengjingii]